MHDILEYMNFALAVFILDYASAFVFLLTVWLVSRVDSARKFSDYKELSVNTTWSEELDDTTEREKLLVNETRHSILTEERGTVIADTSLF